ncbi:hypothetical protein CPB83DRAFT_899988 [Crepidotus variabilis]|uniref:Uncharacterized protein n=1 Tax=Crepidotus variabilis TaxID=179855 RepID=A0A9P6E3U2_9AGAR|nr:hypothetical protein CPB83DRAFT_899988 [Crepidotus variabilis]
MSIVALFLITSQTALIQAHLSELAARLGAKYASLGLTLLLLELVITMGMSISALAPSSTTYCIKLSQETIPSLPCLSHAPRQDEASRSNPFKTTAPLHSLRHFSILLFL